MAATGPASIVLVDDHPVVLDGVVEFLRKAPEFDVVAECRDGQRGLEALRQFRPAIALLDFSLPDMDGLELLAAISSENLATRSLFFSAAPTDGQIAKALAGGAYGVLLKDVRLDELRHALNEVAEGKVLPLSDLVRAAVERERQRAARAELIQKLLTEREKEILMLAAAALSNKEIGNKLDLVEGTVKLHVHNIYRKLGIGSRTALIELVEECRGQL
jgi:two-component system nitrate/nitrite response regulator NarL